MSTEVRILQEFKKNTDAIDTLKGFLYQYLVTLRDWLDYYDKDIEIYCETEDDIKTKELISGKVTFTQVKAYSKDFKITDIEVRKALANFFQLYVDYKDIGINANFIFHTNTDFEGDFFELISGGTISLTATEKDECISYIEKVLINHYIEKFLKDRKVIKKEIFEAKKYFKVNPNCPTIGRKISKWNRTKQEFDDNKLKKEKNNTDFILIRNFIKTESPNFIDKIEWKAEKENKDDAIENLINRIINKIELFDEFKHDPDTVFAVLINKILFASSEKDITKRKLTKAGIDEIKTIINDIEEIKKKVQNIELLSYFNKILKDNKIQIVKLDKVLSELGEIKSDVKETKSDVKEIKADLKEIKENLSRREYKPSLSSFNSYSKDIFNFLNQPTLFNSNTDRIIEKYTPRMILDELKNNLFFPEGNLSVNELEEKLLNESLDKELWKGWLRFLVFMQICSLGLEKINAFHIKLSISRKKFLFLNSSQEITSKVKFQFTENKNFFSIAQSYIHKGIAELNQPNVCLVFNSNMNPFGIGHFTFKQKQKIVNNIGGQNMDIPDKLNFGIINFHHLLTEISDCEKQQDFVSKFKDILKNAIEN